MGAHLKGMVDIILCTGQTHVCNCTEGATVVLREVCVASDA